MVINGHLVSYRPAGLSQAVLSAAIEQWHGIVTLENWEKHLPTNQVQLNMLQIWNLQSYSSTGGLILRKPKSRWPISGLYGRFGTLSLPIFIQRMHMYIHTYTHSIWDKCNVRSTKNYRQWQLEDYNENCTLYSFIPLILDNYGLELFAKWQ